MTLTPEQEKIIDRVRKMHRKAESAKEIGSLAEAEAFAEAVEKTLTAHKLSMEHVLETADVVARQDPLGRTPAYTGMKTTRRWEWVEDLAAVVADAHYCRFLIHKNSNHITFVGRLQDREVAAYVFTVLVTLAQELCAQGKWKARTLAKKETGVATVAGFKESFYRGFVNQIGRRYRRLREQNAMQPGMALVLSRSADELNEYLKDIPMAKATASRGSEAHHEAGYRAGKTAADAAHLQAKATARRKELGS